MKEYMPHFKELWLARRFMPVKGVEPFSSIMSLSQDTANMVAHQAGKRFDGDYIEERRQVEDWLRAGAEAQSVVIESTHPLYFRLYPRPIKFSRNGEKIITLRLGLLPAENLSFTFDDSFHNYASLGGRPSVMTTEPRVYSFHQMDQQLAETGFPSSFDGGDPGRYIEVQLWSRPPILSYLGEVAMRNS